MGYRDFLEFCPHGRTLAYQLKRNIKIDKRTCNLFCPIMDVKYGHP